MSCVTIPDIGLPNNWARSAHLGLTATTGQLADNHDIISLKSYDETQLVGKDEVEDSNKHRFHLDVQQSFESQLKRYRFLGVD